jgi:hypothetical protein
MRRDGSLHVLRYSDARASALPLLANMRANKGPAVDNGSSTCLGTARSIKYRKDASCLMVERVPESASCCQRGLPSIFRFGYITPET